MKRSEIRPVVSRYGLVLNNVSTYNSYYAKGVVYRVETQRGVVMVKPYRGTLTRLSAVYRRVGNLRRMGYGYFPRWQLTRTGRAWTRYQGRLYYVTEWIDGRGLGGNLRDYELLGEALGSLHRKAIQVSQKTRTKTFEALHAYHKRCNRILATYGNKRSSVYLGSWYSNRYDDVVSQADHAWTDVFRQLKMNSNLRISMVHGDVTIPNVVLAKNRAMLVDIEQVKPGLSTLELSKALANTTEFRVSKIQAMLRGYESECPLTRIERQFLLASFRIPREFYMALAQSHRGTAMPKIAMIFRDTWDSRQSAIEWLRGWVEEMH